MSCVALSPSVNQVTKIQWFKKGDTDVEEDEGITTTLGEFSDTSCNRYLSCTKQMLKTSKQVKKELVSHDSS